MYIFRIKCMMSSWNTSVAYQKNVLECVMGAIPKLFGVNSLTMPIYEKKWTSLIEQHLGNILKLI